MDEQLLYKYFEGHASEAEMKKVKDWYDASADNQATFRRERKLFDSMILVGGIEHKAEQSPKHKVKSIIRECLKIASVAAIAIILSTIWFLNEKGQDDERMQTVIVPTGQRVNLLLPDGTNVWLNAGTRMTYPLSFAKKIREIVLDGEAYFEVMHDEKCPFIVHTSAMDVKVLGTKFNVEAYSCQQRYETTLMGGQVKVAIPGKDETSVLLSPGQKTALKDGQLIVENISDYNVYRWKEGLYCFRDKPFSEILKDLERYYDLNIQLKKSSIANVTITGKFRISEGLDYILHILQTEVSFTYSREQDNEITIR